MEQSTQQIESLVSSLWREYRERGVHSGIAKNTSAYNFDMKLYHLRLGLVFYLVGQRLNELPSNVKERDDFNQWFQRISNNLRGNDLSGFDPLGSIGQHYCSKTGYLDASSNMQVALWMATHDFDTGDFLGAGVRVIYRICRQRLSETELYFNTVHRLSGDRAVRHVFIGDTPEEIAPRASAQQGWSIIGFDDAEVLRELIGGGGIRAFCFTSSDTPSGYNLDANLIKPPNDRMVELFGEYNIGLDDADNEEDLQRWLDQCLNPRFVGNGLPRIDLMLANYWTQLVENIVGSIAT